MSERKILYLVNPISGTKKKEKFLKDVSRLTQNRNIAFDLNYTNAEGNYSLIDNKIREENFTDVIIIGGDGSVNQVVQGLKHLPVKFGIIPMGSGNGLAFSSGIPKDPYDALQIVFACKSKNTDAFEVNGKFSCMLSGLGLDAQVAHDFANKASRGLMMYTQQSLVNYLRAMPYQFEVQLPDFSFFTDAFFICVANSNQFGNNVRIAPQASLNDGLFDIVIVRKMNKLMLPFALLHQISGSNAIEELKNYRNNKNIIYFQAREATIINNGSAPLHIDGEPEPLTHKIKFKILPNAFRLLQPSV